MEQFDLFGELSTGPELYRAQCKLQSGHHTLTLAVTDFVDRAWECSTTFQSLAQAQYDYVVDDRQLYKWLSTAFATERPAMWHSAEGTYVAVHVTEGEIDLEIRVPPEGSMALLEGRAQRQAACDIAFGMLRQLGRVREGERQSATEVARLKSEVRDLEEEVERLKGLLSSKGAQASSKGNNQRGQSQSHAASSQAGFVKTQSQPLTPISKRSRPAESQQETGAEPLKGAEPPQGEASEQAGQPADEPSEAEGEEQAKGPEVDPGIGRARVVQGRGRRGAGHRGRRGFGRLGGS